MEGEVPLGGLGYRGFVVSRPVGSWTAYDGTVTDPGGAPGTYLADPGHLVERYLLASGIETLAEDEAAAVMEASDPLPARPPAEPAPATGARALRAGDVCLSDGERWAPEPLSGPQAQAIRSPAMVTSESSLRRPPSRAARSRPISRASMPATPTSGDGNVATYIPELAKADPHAFGIAIATVQGSVYEVGDTRLPFTLQSLSKPFTYACALGLAR